MKIIIKIVDNYYEGAVTDDDVDGAADGDDNRFEGRVVCPWKSKEVNSCAKTCSGMLRDVPWTKTSLFYKV